MQISGFRSTAGRAQTGRVSDQSASTGGRPWSVSAKRGLLRLAGIASVFAVLAVGQSSTAFAQNTKNFPVLGEIVRVSPELDALVPKDAKIEVLGSGFEWAEGPAWVKDGGYLLFSDIPRNSVMKWKYGEGVSLFLKPSGYTGPGEYGTEPGSNGLMINRDGLLVSCEHGDRRVSVVTPNGGKRTLADNYKGKRFNSPNDLCQKSNGDIYFTDPPYGLPGNFADPRREQELCGVYRLTAAGEVTRVSDEMTRPNGIAFSPDEKTLYVAQSDPQAAIWKKFAVKADGTLGPGEVFYDATSMVGKYPGLPDGLKVDQHGNLFATGPGGVLIFSPQGKLLGRFDTREATANCGWGDDGQTLYITADMYLCRVITTTRGAGWSK
jgi:gluconolactonase